MGGFSSASLRKGLAARYGLYATNKRLFGVYDRLANPRPWPAGRPPGHGLDRVLSKKGAAGMIKELERRRDLEVRREEVALIEIRRPSWLHRGRILINLTSGTRIDMWVLANRDVDRAIAILRRFYPEVLRMTAPSPKGRS